MISYDDTSEYGAKIKIVGVGGGGCNAVNGMIQAGLNGVDFIAINTDVQALEKNGASHKVQIGKSLTKGLGAGANPDVGKRAAEENIEDIRRSLEGADLVFVTAGMGGGTGTGAAPVIAEAARNMGALTIGIVTKPFAFEREKRMKVALSGIEALRQCVDTLIVIPNEKLLSVLPKETRLPVAFQFADNVLYRATKGISDIINNTGYINVDFADVKKVMSNAGDAIMGMGIGKGDKRGEEAVHQAIHSPLLEDNHIDGATGVLLNFTCPQDITLDEVSEISTLITKVAHPEADVIWGYAIDESLQNEIHVTVIAAGINSTRVARKPHTEAEEKPKVGLSLMTKKTVPVPVPRITDRIGERRLNQAENYHIPAIQRQNDPPPEMVDITVTESKSLKPTGTYNAEDADIPAFLRNHMKR